MGIAHEVGGDGLGDVEETGKVGAVIGRGIVADEEFGRHDKAAFTVRDVRDAEVKEELGGALHEEVMHEEALPERNAVQIGLPVGKVVHGRAGRRPRGRRLRGGRLHLCGRGRRRLWGRRGSGAGGRWKGRSAGGRREGRAP